MSNQGNEDWVPIAAGVVVGAGILALIYKMLFTGCRKNVNTPFNQQQNAPYKCTCKKGGKDPSIHANSMPSDSKLPALSKLECKSSKMCDCAIEIDRLSRGKKEPKKKSHSVQTDAPVGLDLGALFGGMIDGVGPWLPYIGGSALFILLLGLLPGLLSKNVDRLLGMFEGNFDENEKPSMSASPDAEAGSCRAKCTFRINSNKIKWPNNR